MTRMYIQPSFLDSCTEHGEWSGGNDQYRGDRSVDFSTFTKGGRARVEAFSDDALAKSKPKTKKVPIASRIIPAQATLNRVDQQEKELNEAYENSEISLEEYEDLLYCLQSKRDRAHKSLCKALGKSVEDEPVGQHRVEPENVCKGLESQCYSPFTLDRESLSKSEGVIGKIVEKDDIYFLLSSLVVFIVGFMVFS